MVEDDPELFAAYVLWVYNQDWTHTHGSEEHPNHVLCALYVLADKYGSEAFQNAIIDEFRARALHPDKDFHLPLATVGYVYENTLAGTPLRRLLADFIAFESKIHECQALVELAPQCLFDALERLIVVKNRVPIPYLGDAVCKAYHIHQDGTSCPAPVPVALRVDDHKSSRKHSKKHT